MMPHEKTKSLQYLDVLRVLAAFAVVFTHVSSKVLFSTVSLTSLDWWISNFAVSASRWCIPVFVMISGALLLDPSKNETPTHFYKKRFQRILIPLIFWTLFYLAIRYASSPMTLKTAIYHTLNGEPFYHLWYLYMILGLYFFTPFLRTYVKHSTSNERAYLIGTIFILTNCYLLLNKVFLDNKHSVFTLFIPYIAYYLCGYQLRLLDPRKISFRYLVITIAVCVLCICIGTGILTRILNTQKCLMLYNYLGFPVIVLSIAFFLTIYRMAYPGRLARGMLTRLVEQVGPTTLGIYLLHAAILEMIRSIIGQARIAQHSLFTIPAITVITFLLCYIIVFVVIRIPFLKSIVGCGNFEIRVTDK